MWLHHSVFNLHKYSRSSGSYENKIPMLVGFAPRNLTGTDLVHLLAKLNDNYVSLHTLVSTGGRVPD